MFHQTQQNPPGFDIYCKLIDLDKIPPRQSYINRTMAPCEGVYPQEPKICLLPTFVGIFSTSFPEHFPKAFFRNLSGLD
jgi:hypothetical protein